LGALLRYAPRLRQSGRDHSVRLFTRLKSGADTKHG
jgi:hypothetical protein